jgi:hypothetical protein
MIGFITVGVGACASAIDRTADIERARFTAGVTTRRGVVDAVGLPVRVDRNTANGTETWYYTGTAKTQGRVVTDGKPVLLTCVFGPDGRLLQSIRTENPR